LPNIHKTIRAFSFFFFLSFFGYALAHSLDVFLVTATIAFIPVPHIHSVNTSFKISTVP